MYLRKQAASNGRLRLRLIEKYKRGNKQKEITLLNLGYISENDHETLEKYQWFVNLFNELTAKSDEEKEKVDPIMETEDRFDLNLGYCFIKHVLALFDYRSVFAPVQRKHFFKYQLYQIFFYEIYDTIISPNSLLGSIKDQKYFYEDFGIESWDLYRSLDIFYELDDKLRDREMKVILNHFTDSLGLFYVDSTNTFTYSEEDAVGKGLRHKGYGKDGKTEPLVGMSLMMTHNGFPLAMQVYPGNENDSVRLIPLLKATGLSEKVPRFLISGDSAFNSGTNNFYLAGYNLPGDLNNGFVFSQSVKKAKKEILQWLYDPKGWKYGIDKNWGLEELNERKENWKPRYDGEAFYKTDYKTLKMIRNCKVWVKERSKKVTTTQRVRIIACFSERLRAKKLHSIEKKIKKAEEELRQPKLLKTELEKSTKDYIKVTEGVEEPDIFELNEEKIKRDCETAGYYLLETSECDLDPETVIHLFNDKYLIEWLFRTIKSELHLRPIYVQKPEHITALIHLRFSALLVIRTLEFFLESKYSVEQIIKSLRGFGCVKVGNRYEIYGRDEIIRELEKLFGLHFKSSMTKKEIDRQFSYKSMLEAGPQLFSSFCRDLVDSKLSEKDWKTLNERAKVSKIQ